MGVFNPMARESVFEPETTHAMGIAFERACTELRLTDQSDPISKLLADRSLSRLLRSDWPPASSSLPGVANAIRMSCARRHCAR